MLEKILGIKREYILAVADYTGSIMLRDMLAMHPRKSRFWLNKKLIEIYNNCAREFNLRAPSNYNFDSEHQRTIRTAPIL